MLASHFEGKELNSPNDIVVGNDGAIYFTDPTYGRMPVYGVERPSRARISAASIALRRAAARWSCWSDKTMFTQPNGLVLLAGREAALCQ